MSRVRVPDGAPLIGPEAGTDLRADPLRLVGQAVKTPASHAGNGGSIPPRVIQKREKLRESNPRGSERKENIPVECF